MRDAHARTHLIAAQVPHPVHFAVDLLKGQQVELTVRE